MTALTLSQHSTSRFALDMSPFIPQQLAGLNIDQISRLPLQHGSDKAELGDFYTVGGSAAERLVIENQDNRLLRVGQGMSQGELQVEGDAGDEAGFRLNGGSLRINGNCGDHAGRAMRGGVLQIDGNCGMHLGGPAAGERQGMRGGLIRVGGDAGDRAGERQRRGMILIHGDCGDYCALDMIAGSLCVAGQAGAHSGHGMRRGSLVLQNAPASMPTTFQKNGPYDAVFLRLLHKELQRLAFIAQDAPLPPVERYLGDIACNGQGEILMLG